MVVVSSQVSPMRLHALASRASVAIAVCDCGGVGEDVKPAGTRGVGAIT